MVGRLKGVMEEYGRLRESCVRKSVDELLALTEGKESSFLFALEVAIQEKAERDGNISEQECIVLAVEALEREVNNGGYNQFLVNSSRMYAPNVVESLVRIGCPQVAAITRQAIEAIRPTAWTIEAIATAVGSYAETERARWKSELNGTLIKGIPVDEDDSHDAMRKALSECDKSFYSSQEHIGARLIEFIKANKDSIQP